VEITYGLIMQAPLQAQRRGQNFEQRQGRVAGQPGDLDNAFQLGLHMGDFLAEGLAVPA
jgi:hypothetical protein